MRSSRWECAGIDVWAGTDRTMVYKPALDGSPNRTLVLTPARKELPICSEPVWLARTSSGVSRIGERAEAAGGAPRKRTSASLVSCDRSSITQCPVLGRVTDEAFVATSLTCLARASPLALSPPIDRTGMGSFV